MVEELHGPDASPSAPSKSAGTWLCCHGPKIAGPPTVGTGSGAWEQDLPLAPARHRAQRPLLLRHLVRLLLRALHGSGATRLLPPAGPGQATINISVNHVDGTCQVQPETCLVHGVQSNLSTNRLLSVREPEGDSGARSFGQEQDSDSGSSISGEA